MLRRGLDGETNLAEFVEGDTLNLSGKGVTPAFALDIQVFLRNHPEITSLNLSNNDQVDDDLIGGLNELGGKNAVRRLNISNTHVSNMSLILYATTNSSLIEIVGNSPFNEAEASYWKNLIVQRKPAYESEMEMKVTQAELEARAFEEKIKIQEIEKKKQEEVQRERNKIKEELLGGSNEDKEVEKYAKILKIIKSQNESLNVADDQQLLMQVKQVDAALRAQQEIINKNQQLFDSMAAEIKSLEDELAKKTKQLPELEQKEQKAKAEFQKKYTDIAKRKKDNLSSLAAASSDLIKSIEEEAMVGMQENLKGLKVELREAIAQVSEKEKALEVVKTQFVAKIALKPKDQNNKSDVKASYDEAKKQSKSEWDRIEIAAKKDYEEAKEKVRILDRKIADAKKRIDKKSLMVRNSQAVIDDLKEQEVKLNQEEVALKEQEVKEMQAFSAIRAESDRLSQEITLKGADQDEARIKVAKAQDESAALKFKLSKVKQDVEARKEERSAALMTAQNNLLKAENNKKEKDAEMILGNIKKYLMLMHPKTSSATIKAQLKIIDNSVETNVQKLEKIRKLGFESAIKSKFTRSKKVQAYLDCYKSQNKFMQLFGPMNVSSPEVAKEILLREKQFIIDSPTKMRSGLFAAQIILPDGSKKAVSDHSALNYHRIEQAEKASHSDPNVWLEALRDVTLASRSAALFRHGFRKDETQQHYELFLSGNESRLHRDLRLDSSSAAVAKKKN